MTLNEWLACGDPRPMLAFLQGRISQRKQRLFVLACCRQFFGDWEDPATQFALECADCFAESIMRVRKLQVVVDRGQAALDCGASDPLLGMSLSRPDGTNKPIARTALHPLLVNVLEVLACSHFLGYWLDWFLTSLDQAGFSLDRQAELLRDVIRGPFEPLYFQAAWRTQEDVVRVAEAIRAEGAFEQLGVLADALEDAGCDSEEILAHLRGPGPHVRGCWPLDLVLERQSPLTP